MPPGMVAGIPLITVGRLDGPLQRAIHTYKYRPRPELATALSACLAGAVRESGIRIAVLTFVPPAQVGLGETERRANMVGAFCWSGTQPPPEQLALVDDVSTTGATLEAAAEAVGRAGGSIGAFLALARAQTLPALAVTFPGQSTCP